MAGFTQGPHFDKLGMRGSNTGELIFEDCEVPFENVLGEEGRGVAVLMSGLDYERVVLSGIGTGIMAACLDEVMPYMVERKQFGQPIGNFQLMQGKIADMYTAMNSARAYVYAVARACDRGEVTRQDAAACVLYASEEAMKQAHQAVQALGGAGFLNDSGRQPALPRCEAHGDRRGHVRDPADAGRARVDGVDGLGGRPVRAGRLT
jgi:isovaleryl-CoA dehydrogenase